MERVTSAGAVKPVAIEPTSDGLAAVFTTFVQLPGESLAPNRFAAASALVILKLCPPVVQQQLNK